MSWNDYKPYIEELMGKSKTQDNKLKEAAEAASQTLKHRDVINNADKPFCFYSEFLAGAAYEREQQSKRVCGGCKYYYVPDTYSGLICNKGIDFPGDDLVDDSTFGCNLWEGK